MDKIQLSDNIQKQFQIDSVALLKYLIDKYCGGSLIVELSDLPSGELYFVLGYGYDNSKVRSKIFAVSNPEKQASTIAEAQGTFPKN